MFAGSRLKKSANVAFILMVLSTKCTETTVSFFFFIYLALYTFLHSANRRTGSINAVQERQSLLEQFIQLPGDPGPNEVPTRPPGEILVSFYNHELLLSPESDDESGGGIDEGDEIEGVPESQKSTCLPVPLQYLYNFPSNGEEMINEAALRGLFPPMPAGGANLGVMYVTSIQFGSHPYVYPKRCVDRTINPPENSQ